LECQYFTTEPVVCVIEHIEADVQEFDSSRQVPFHNSYESSKNIEEIILKGQPFTAEPAVSVIEANKQELSSGKQVLLNNSNKPKTDIEKIEQEDQPFAGQHDWQATRYSGKIVYLIVLISQWGWLRLVMDNYGVTYQIFMIFLFLTTSDTPSIEQLKNIRNKEAALVLGMKNIPCLSNVRKKFHAAARLKSATVVMDKYFKFQVDHGMVDTKAWYVDGHLFPYTGKMRTH
jgi:hypothetical protein